MKKVTTKAKEPVRLRMKTLANGSKSLYLDVYREGKRQYEFLKLYLIPESTAADKQQNIETLRTANAIKSQRVVALQNEEAGFKKAKGGKADLIEYLQLLADEYKRQGSSQAEVTLLLINHLQAYNNGKKVMLQDVTAEYLLGFAEYLKGAADGRYKKAGRKLAKNTQQHYFNRLGVALNEAVRRGLIAGNPTRRLTKAQRPKGHTAARAYLTFDELRVLAATESPSFATKQAFLFSCFCGLRLCDVKRLSWRDIKTMSDGSKQIEIRQQKTDEMLYLPLSENALKWLPERQRGTDKVFQLLSMRMIENHLKAWVSAAGIDKHITFHCARHTFATLELTFGADIYHVSKLLGHTNVKTSQVYANVINENKKKAVNLIPTL